MFTKVYRKSGTKHNKQVISKQKKEEEQNVTHKFDQNPENENKHKYHKGNIQKKLIPSFRSRFNSSNKTNVSILYDQRMI